MFNWALKMPLAKCAAGVLFVLLLVRPLLFSSSCSEFSEYFRINGLGCNFSPPYFQETEAVVLRKKALLKNFAKSLGKHMCQSLFLNKVAGFRSATFLKKRLRHRCFPMKFTKFLRTLFLQNTSRCFF